MKISQLSKHYLAILGDSIDQSTDLALKWLILDSLKKEMKKSMRNIQKYNLESVYAPVLSKTWNW